MKRTFDEVVDLGSPRTFEVLDTPEIPALAQRKPSRFQRFVAWGVESPMALLGLAVVVGACAVVAVCGRDLPRVMQEIADDTAALLVDQPPQI